MDMEKMANSLLFDSEFEAEAIERIRKFARLSDSLGFEVAVGFSGGKDSQVVYDLCKRSGIQFIAYFNHSFEDVETLRFIKQFYPEVIWRRDHKFWYVENIWKNHNSLLPTSEFSYCCADYKHNVKYVDNASIVGVRRAESQKRKSRKVFEAKNKTTIKKNKELFSNFFSERCSGVGTGSIIQLKPIVDWSDEEVWNYIERYGLPQNPAYSHGKRVGCIVCPKANFESNYYFLCKYPKLVDAFIAAREKRENIDWKIIRENADFQNDKLQYICRWLNHSFRPFTKKQKKLYENFKNIYYASKQTTDNANAQ